MSTSASAVSRENNGVLKLSPSAVSLYGDAPRDISVAETENGVGKRENGVVNIDSGIPKFLLEDEEVHRILPGFEMPKTQTAALVRRFNDFITFDKNYPVPELKRGEVLAKVLYTGVCQSDLHTMQGTAAGDDGKPILNIKFPHVGGHEGIGKIVVIAPGCPKDIKLGGFVGIRFSSRICRRCDYCLAGKEQHCVGLNGVKPTNHLHHEDGSFQEYIALDADYLTVLPDNIDPVDTGPVLCAGLTAYKACLNSNAKAGNWLVVIGAGGGLGHFAVQYARAMGMKVIGIDGGPEKSIFVQSLGASFYIDFKATPDTTAEVLRLTDGGAHAVVLTAGSARAAAQAASMLRIGGTLSCVGIPVGQAFIETPLSTIVIKGLHITGNLVGSLKECMEAIDFVRRGTVRPMISVRDFFELPKVYEELKNGEVLGRVVLKIAKD